MKKIIFFLLLIIGLFYNSCKKDPFENKTVIEGYILEYGSEKPLPNVKIYFSGLVSSEIFGTEVWTTVDSITTDENGYVHYEYNHNDITIDKATFKTPHLYYPIMLHAINERQVNDISRLVDPHSWIRFHIKNVAEANGTDQITIAGPWGGGANDDRFFGQIDIETIRMVRGNRDVGILWRVDSLNNIRILEDSVTCNAHDTTYYEIL